MSTKDINSNLEECQDPFLPESPYKKTSISLEDPTFIKSTEEEEKSPKNAKTGWRRYLGVFYTVIAVNMFALTSIVLKKYSYINPFVVGVWMTPGAFIFTICIIVHSLYVQKKKIFEGLFPIKKNKKNLFFLLLRAFFTSIISYLTIFAFSYITPGDLRTVVSAAVIVVFILGWMCLGEECGVVPVIVALIAMLGIGIMMRPPMLTGEKEFDRNSVIGIGISCACLVVVSFNLLLVRYLQGIHHAVTNIFVYIWGPIQGAIVATVLGVFTIPEFKDILGLNLGGLFLAVGLMCLVLALQEEEAGVVALLKTSEVIFVFGWQIILLGRHPDLYSIVGAALVILGVVAVTLRKFVASLPPKSAKRRWLKFLLL